MGTLTTHVLDTTIGEPAEGMHIDFAVREESGWRHIKTMRTDADGRSKEPLLSGTDMRAGEYELAFHVADYFRSKGQHVADPPFLDVVPLRFGIADTNAHYHVPLLCTPWSYTTYRGS